MIGNRGLIKALRLQSDRKPNSQKEFIDKLLKRSAVEQTFCIDWPRSSSDPSLTCSFLPFHPLFILLSPPLRPFAEVFHTSVSSSVRRNKALLQSHSRSLTATCWPPYRIHISEPVIIMAGGVLLWGWSTLRIGKGWFLNKKWGVLLENGGKDIEEANNKYVLMPLEFWFYYKLVHLVLFDFFFWPMKTSIST